MKKKYVNPEMEIIEIKTQMMLAASIPQGGTYGGGDVEGHEDEGYDW